MNLAIITTYYPPDTAIASVRPFCFAKYLTKLGHNVTVIKSTHTEHGLYDNFLKNDKRIKIYDYDEFSQKHLKVHDNDNIKLSNDAHSLMWFIPMPIRKIIYNIINGTKELFCKFFNSKLLLEIRQSDMLITNTQKKLFLLKKLIDYIYDQEFINYDVVFSTYGELENIEAGKYFADKFTCKWIMDFRDPVCSPIRFNAYSRFVLKKYEKFALSVADYCVTVSEDFTKQYKKSRKTNILTLYNGFDSIDDKYIKQPERDFIGRINVSKKDFIFVYTGFLYSYSRKSLDLFIDALQYLINNNVVDTQHIKIIYAGPSENEFIELFNKKNLDGIVINMGMIPRNQIVYIQNLASIFLCLSWNTRKMKGMLTGKFYEGIRSNKPILTVLSGNVTNSELYRLNQEYNYGFSYEACRGKLHFEELCNWLIKLYKEKISNGYIDFSQSQAIRDKFHYKNLTKELEQICLKLIEDK